MKRAKLRESNLYIKSSEMVIPVVTIFSCYLLYAVTLMYLVIGTSKLVYAETSFENTYTRELVYNIGGIDHKYELPKDIYESKDCKKLQEAAMSEARKNFGKFEEEFRELGDKIKIVAEKSASMAKDLHNLATDGMSQRDMQRQREELEKHAKDMSAMMASMWSSPDAQDLMAALGMPGSMSNVWGNFGETSSDNQ